MKIDDVVEHNIMLRKMDKSELDIDKYYRVVANGCGADWTFVCPSNYQGITDKIQRISRFYSDGYEAIRVALETLGYSVPIEIPKRYHRHLDMLKDDSELKL
ncbi:hypothetical protein HY792_05690 [Candidatus Desantisbacteria bacterium]|nr:hypothetical protein [Candidatus Desantisbacteria bacterium]